MNRFPEGEPPPKFNPQLPSEWEQEVMESGNSLRAEREKERRLSEPPNLIPSKEVENWLEHLNEIAAEMSEEEIDYYRKLLRSEREEVERDLEDGILPPEQRLN